MGCENTLFMNKTWDLPGLVKLYNLFVDPIEWVIRSETHLTVISKANSKNKILYDALIGL